MRAFNPLEYPLALDTPHRLTDIADWHRHIPFAFTLVEMLRPRLLVELGTYKGDSFCAMCQAVSALRLDTSCIAIDTWMGDIHTGRYDEDIYLDLLAHVEERYGRFATLVRSTFDEAVDRFSDSSIDLLHIDGTHTYDAVKHDFEQWLGKLSHRGVVVLHDTHERYKGFGVYHLWHELRERYPSCEFAYGHGLGVIATGTEVPEELQALFETTRANPAVAQWFQVLGERVHRMQHDHAKVACWQNKVATLTQRIAEMQSQHQQQGEQQEALAEKLSACEREMLRLREVVQSLEAQVSMYAGEIAQIEAQRRAAETQRIALQARMESQASEAAVLQGDLEACRLQLQRIRTSTPYRVGRVLRHPKLIARKLHIG